MKVLGTLVLVAGLVLAASAASGTEDTISACVNAESGNVRILEEVLPDVIGRLLNTPAELGGDCTQDETLVAWSVQGPIGLTGPAGPEGPEGPAGSGGGIAEVRQTFAPTIVDRAGGAALFETDDHVLSCPAGTQIVNWVSVLTGGDNFAVFADASGFGFPEENATSLVFSLSQTELNAVWLPAGPDPIDLSAPDGTAIIYCG